MEAQEDMGARGRAPLEGRPAGMEQPTVDPDMASQFLHLLDEDSIFTFQTFDESNARSARLARVFHGTLEQHLSALREMNDAGAGIFVMVNAGDGCVHDGSKTCRTEANVMRVRAVFVDLDGAPVAPVLCSPAPPDWIVASSIGRWHAYWRVNDCPLETFGIVQDALARNFGGDRSVKDLPRVMRVPGFVHRKNAPFRSRLYLPGDYDEVMENNNGQ